MTVERWAVESLHKLKFYLSVLLLMIKMSQSAREKSDSYCKKAYWSLILDLWFIHSIFHKSSAPALGEVKSDKLKLLRVRIVV